MTIVEQLVGFGQEHSDTAASGEPGREEENPTREKPTTIGALLKNLRGEQSLRQVEAATGISNTYLCNLEGGSKRPGLKTLAKLAVYYQVPLPTLLQASGLQLDEFSLAPTNVMDVMDVKRSYDFVLADPGLSLYQKPAGALPTDVQKFVVEMYQHYTGKKLL